MDNQAFINILIGVCGVFGGWILNNITRAVNKLEDKIAGLPVVYVQKDDYRRDIDDVKAMLKQIFDKLDNKADK
jgi:cell fate (sporulation/competence/biofilm development) regulator YmcA (YheA/YmcA/DUF963 family)